MKASLDRRRVVALVALVCIAVGSAAGLTTGLVSCTPAQETAQIRPLSATEAQRLAGMRARNYQDGRVGIRATVGKPGTEIRLAGWVDWRRQLAYLAATAPAPGPDDGLLQAVPGIVATRPGRADGGLPPATPPVGDWRVRPSTATAAQPAVIDSFLALLFTVADAAPSDQSGTVAELLVSSESRWLGRDTVEGRTVDVLLGPAVPPRIRPTGSPTPTPTPTGPVGPASPTPAPGSLAAMGGAVRYWLDGDARLHRYEALLAKDLPVKVDLTRGEQPQIAAIDAFGGRITKPRKLSTAEADLLAKMRQRNRAVGGGELTLTVPMLPAGVLRAKGWIDWRKTRAYLGVYDPDTPKERILMRVSGDGVSVRAKGYTAGKLPPMPVPGGGWEFIAWSKRGDALGGLDLDMLLNEALAVSSSRRDDAKALRKAALWLRTDTIGGAPVTVFEISKVADVGGARGQARIRYWVDRNGGLRRLELRTRVGAFGQLDIKPGDVPL
ncbi:hypothetical protein [Phytohabitans rumicis]|uniref:Lipoprotein n=1 Tax=Phytohabitans rumicis TaxID=1076125 RepID=A0A6V8L6D0_9ACTN|nr:hypothetical protein [Phytohabitans rumicis]GFJ88215.1 hypothetical protein Prum_018570 [Phytohabitans rumicis]